LLTPPFSTLTTIANSRLKAIEEHTALGSGFHLAMRDMEIRGAGNLLGRQQHGFIEEVGFDLYCRLLDEAVAEVKGTGSAYSERPVPQIEVEGDKFIPDEYVEDNQQRFELYKRMAEVRDMDSVDDLQLEITDRFGSPPIQVNRLLDLARCRVLAQKAGITRATAKGPRWSVFFEADAAIDRNRVAGWRESLGARAEFVMGPPFRIDVRPELGQSVGLDGLLGILKALQS
jgi:transcription-repair coupling factor (superfamily II helicase)